MHSSTVDQSRIVTAVCVFTWLGLRILLISIKAFDSRSTATQPFLETTKQIGVCHASMSVLQPSGRIMAGRSFELLTGQ